MDTWLADQARTRTSSATRRTDTQPLPQRRRQLARRKKRQFHFSPFMASASMASAPKAPEDKLVTAARGLAAPLREKWSSVLSLAADRLSPSPTSDPKGLESRLEDFYAICDQMELHLRAAEACMQQTSSSSRNMPIMPALNRLEQPLSAGQTPEFLSYSQFLAKSKQHGQFARDVRQVLQQASGQQQLAPNPGQAAMAPQTRPQTIQMTQQQQQQQLQQRQQGQQRLQQSQLQTQAKSVSQPEQMQQQMQQQPLRPQQQPRQNQGGQG